MNTPTNLQAVNLPHPTNPKAIVLLTQDNASAIQLLRSFKPEWIDEMPVTASVRSAGKGNVAQCGHYDEHTRRGMLAFYFGAGCNADDAGWEVLSVSGATEEEFNTVALPHSFGVMIRIRRPHF
jgi:hypothetical protein